MAKRMDGKVVVITGANSGVGRAGAEQLAALGARVILVVRNEQRGREAISDLETKTGRGAFELVLADLAELAQVRRAAAEIRAKHPRIHVLANNAGVYLPRRVVTSEGHEAMLALNHLAPFVLTHELLSPLSASGEGRVITTSSMGHRLARFDLEDLEAERSFHPLNQYNNTKLANVLFTRALAKRVRSRGIVAHACHPGLVATGFAQDEPGLFKLVVKAGRPFLRSAEKAARTLTYLAASSEAGASSGDYFVDSKRRKPSSAGRNDALAEALWTKTEGLTGLRWQA